MENTEQSVALTPTDAFLFFPAEDQKRTGEGKKLIRWVFEGNTKFEDFEVQTLETLYEKIERDKIQLPEDWKRSDSLKFLIACSFNIDKALKGMQEYIEWRKATLPIELTPKVLEYLNSGIMYMHGRDHRYRPILIFNCYMLDTKNDDSDQLQLAMGYFMEYVIKNALLPGQVERWVFIIDLKGMGITSIPFVALKKILSFLQNNFRSRLHRMYIMNSPSTIYFSWKMVKPLLEETTTQKINFSKESKNDNLFNHANKKQVEEKFGGTAPNIEKDFWPPKPVSSEYYLASDNPSSFLTVKDEYQKMNSEGKLVGYRVSKELLE